MMNILGPTAHPRSIVRARVHPIILTLRDAVSEVDAIDMFSAVCIVSASLIDGGRTMAIRIRKSDANETLILLSPKDAEDLQLRISKALDDPNPP